MCQDIENDVATWVYNPENYQVEEATTDLVEQSKEIILQLSAWK